MSRNNELIQRILAGEGVQEVISSEVALISEESDGVQGQLPMAVRQLQSTFKNLSGVRPKISAMSVEERKSLQNLLFDIISTSVDNIIFLQKKTPEIKDTQVLSQLNRFNKILDTVQDLAAKGTTERESRLFRGTSLREEEEIPQPFDKAEDVDSDDTVSVAAARILQDNEGEDEIPSLKAASEGESGVEPEEGEAPAEEGEVDEAAAKIIQTLADMETGGEDTSEGQKLPEKFTPSVTTEGIESKPSPNMSLLERISTIGF